MGGRTDPDFYLSLPAGSHAPRDGPPPFLVRAAARSATAERVRRALGRRPAPEQQRQLLQPRFANPRQRSRCRRRAASRGRRQRPGGRDGAEQFHLQHYARGPRERQAHAGRDALPAEASGYLHIGHAKSICVNFGLGEQFGGLTYMRFDDTNPEKEEQEYVDGILRDVKWLGFDWKADERQTYASNYFDKFYEYALQLIDEGKAYVDSLSAEEMREYRGTLTKPGKDSPYRTRSVEENRKLFESMAAGEVPDGEMVLRVKIDMASPNMNMRDPAIYRIKRDAEHPLTGRKWKVYPMYDYAHALTGTQCSKHTTTTTTTTTTPTSSANRSPSSQPLYNRRARGNHPFTMYVGV